MTQEELLRLIDQAFEEEWEELDLSGNDLTELPAEIGQLSKYAKNVDSGEMGPRKRSMG